MVKLIYVIGPFNSGTNLLDQVKFQISAVLLLLFISFPREIEIGNSIISWPITFM